MEPADLGLYGATTGRGRLRPRALAQRDALHLGQLHARRWQAPHMGIAALDSAGKVLDWRPKKTVGLSYALALTADAKGVYYADVSDLRFAPAARTP